MLMSFWISDLLNLHEVLILSKKIRYVTKTTLWKILPIRLLLISSINNGIESISICLAMSIELKLIQKKQKTKMIYS